MAAALATAVRAAALPPPITATQHRITPSLTRLHTRSPVVGEARAGSGEWVLFDCSNKLCPYDGMMHAECYAKLVRVARVGGGRGVRGLVGIGGGARPHGGGKARGHSL